MTNCDFSRSLMTYHTHLVIYTLAQSHTEWQCGVPSWIFVTGELINEQTKYLIGENFSIPQQRECMCVYLCVWCVVFVFICMVTGWVWDNCIFKNIVSVIWHGFFTPLVITMVTVCLYRIIFFFQLGPGTQAHLEETHADSTHDQTFLLWGDSHNHCSMTKLWFPLDPIGCWFRTGQIRGRAGLAAASVPFRAMTWPEGHRALESRSAVQDLHCCFQ